MEVLRSSSQEPFVSGFFEILCDLCGSGVGDRVRGRFGVSLVGQWSSEIEVVGGRG